MAGRIPQEIIEEINRRVDILDLVGRYVSLRRTGRNYVGLCPFHNEDTPSFTVTPDKQICYCFGCQKGGGPINFLMEIENLSFVDAARKLAAELGIVIPEKTLSPHEEKKRQERNQILNMHKLAAEFYAAQLTNNANSRIALEYMKKRDIPQELAQSFMLGYAPDNDWEALCRFLTEKGYSAALIEKAGLGGRSAKTGKLYDKFHSRLIFPISDYKGQVIAFGGRIIGDGTPKYLNSTETPIYNKSHNLFGLHQAGANIRKQEQAVIMEGYMDVLMAHRYGVNNAVASLGTALTKEQAQLLHRYADKVLLAYDGDSAGQKASLRGIEILRAAAFDIKLITLPNGMDPDDFLKKEGKEGWDDYIARHALGVLEFLLNAALQKFDKESVHGKSSIVAELLPAIANTQSVVERDSFIRLMADRLGVVPETVYADLRKSGLKIAAPKASTSKAAPLNINLSSRTAHLLRLALENKSIFDKVESELGLDFWNTEAERQLAALVKAGYDEYNWQPAALLEKFDTENAGNPHTLANNKEENIRISAQNEGIKQFLLKLLSKEFPDDNNLRLADEYIRGVKLAIIQQEINNMLERIKNGEANPELLTALTDCQKQMQTLRQSGN